MGISQLKHINIRCNGSVVFNDVKFTLTSHCIYTIRVQCEVDVRKFHIVKTTLPLDLMLMCTVKNLACRLHL